MNAESFYMQGEQLYVLVLDTENNSGDVYRIWHCERGSYINFQTQQNVTESIHLMGLSQKIHPQQTIPNLPIERKK